MPPVPALSPPLPIPPLPAPPVPTPPPPLAPPDPPVTSAGEQPRPLVSTSKPTIVPFRQARLRARRSPGRGDAVLSKAPFCVRGTSNPASPARLPDPRANSCRFPHARLAIAQLCLASIRWSSVPAWALLSLKESTAVGSPRLRARTFAVYRSVTCAARHFDSFADMPPLICGRVYACASLDAECTCAAFASHDSRLGRAPFLITDAAFPDLRRTNSRSRAKAPTRVDARLIGARSLLKRARLRPCQR